MSDLKLGQIIEGTAERDAVHVAVAPVVAAELLSPGEHIGLAADGTACASTPPIGIVDPFLPHDVNKGERFWMFLYPNTITSLRHDWAHPAFNVSPPATTASTVDSEAYLRAFAEKAGLGYDRMLEIVRDYVERDEVWVEHDSEYARNAFYEADENEFWKHVKNVTGLDKPEDASWSAPFSCSC